MKKTRKNKKGGYTMKNITQEKIDNRRVELYKLDKDTRKSLLLFYHWEIMSPAMIRKTANLIKQQNQL